MKFFKAFLLATTFFFTSSINVSARQQPELIINFFYSEICPHCEHEAPFIAALDEKYDRVGLHAFEVSGNRANAVLLKMVGEKLDMQIRGVPFTLIGTKTTTGYLDDENTGQQLEEQVKQCLSDWDISCEDQLAEFLELAPAEETQPATIEEEPTVAEAKEEPVVVEAKPNKEITLPLFGKLNPDNLSLPVLTFMIALLDGFNPCAMWTLVFLIGLLLGMKDRKKMWILGITFILASGLVYFLFLSAWLNLFLFLGMVTWVRITIALVALGASIYSLRDYMTNKNATCKVTGTEKRQKVFTGLKKLVEQKHLWIALIGIILLAFAVNVVELFCSAGLPAIYTQILSLTELSSLQYYSYLLFYIVIFIFDDLAVFVIAMITLKMTGIESKYSHFSRLIGGLLMLIIGVLLLFKPEWLMFG